MTSSDDSVGRFYRELEEKQDKKYEYATRTNDPRVTSRISTWSYLVNLVRERIAPTAPPVFEDTSLTLDECMMILRDVLGGEPTTSLPRWYIITEALARLPAEALQLPLDYAQAHTQAWPPADFPYRLNQEPPMDRANRLALHLRLHEAPDKASFQRLLQLANAPQPPQLQLRSLTLCGAPLTLPQLIMLIQGGPCRALKALELSDVPLPELLRWLLTQLPELSGLEELRLSCPYNEPIKLKELGFSAPLPYLNKLKILSLIHYNWSDLDEQSWERFGPLEELTLHNPYKFIDYSDCDPIPLWSWTDQLRLLELSYVRLSTHELKRFIERGGAGRLQTLRIDSTWLREEQLKLLLSAPLEELRELCLTKIQFGSSAPRLDLDPAKLPRLEHLSLSGDKLSAEIVEALITSPLARQLRVLDLSDNNVNLSVLRALDRLAAGGSLQVLSLRKCKLTEPEIYAMLGLRALPKLSVVSLDNEGETMSPELFQQLKALYKG